MYDYGEPADGQPPYLVMELIDGPSLADEPVRDERADLGLAEHAVRLARR